MKAAYFIIITVVIIILYGPVNLYGQPGLISALEVGSNSVHDKVASNRTVFIRSSSKTDYRTGVDTPRNTPTIQPTLLPSHREFVDLSEILEPSDVIAVTVDKQGKVWGKDGKTRSRLYVINPYSDVKWKLVHDFSSDHNSMLKHIYVSNRSGYIFISAGNKVYRSVAANGTDDLELVLTMYNSGCYASSRSFSDAPDGRMWIGEYGDKYDSSLIGDAAIRVYKSDTEGNPGSFTEILDYKRDFPNEYHDILHMHTVIWNPYNDTLYISMGDYEPKYILKSSKGTGANWVKVQGPTGFETKLQPTCAAVRNDGDIIWGDDAVKPGLWVHHTTDDSFEHVGFDGKMKPTGTLAADLMGWINVFSMFRLNGSIYVPTFPGKGAQDQFFAVAPENELPAFRYIDYFPVQNNAQMKGVLSVAGLANDGYIWCGYRGVHGARSSLKYKPVHFSSYYGLAMDQGVNNKITDPFFNSGHGWSNYTHKYVHATGGKYKGHVGLVRTGNEQQQSFDNSGESGILSFWARRGTAEGSGILVSLSRSGAKVTNHLVTYPYLDEYWRLYSFEVPPAGSPGKGTLTIRLSDKNTGYHYIDGIQLTQSINSRNTLTQRQRKPDQLRTHMDRALSVPFTALGVLDIKYPFDKSGYYTIWETSSQDRKNYVKLSVHDNQLVLCDSTGTIITSLQGLPTQSMKNPNGDALYWALTWDAEGNILLHLATSGSDLESVGGTHSLPPGLKILFDGCSHKAGEEIGGLVIKREIHNAALTFDEIEGRWLD